MTPERLRAMYGNAVDRWLQARQELMPRERERLKFSSRFLERAGLAA